MKCKDCNSFCHACDPQNPGVCKVTGLTEHPDCEPNCDNNQDNNCGNCVYWDDFNGVCFNGLSPFRADFTNSDSVCDEWEGEE